jgi:hypothetical protein
MNSRKIVWLAIRVTVSSALCIVMLAFAVVQAQQWLLRRRAERLLADMRELQSNEGTWKDAQKIMVRWRPWGLGEFFCIPQECFFYVRMRDPVDLLTRGDLDGPPRLPYLIWPSHLLGEKFTLVEASLRVKDGMVEESRFRMNFFGQDEGMARAVSAPEVLDYTPDRWQHPDYYAEKHPGCEGCKLFETGFTHFAGREKIHELTDFNLSCITRWSPCVTEADVMPSAWKLYQVELSRKAALEKAFNSCKIPLEFFGRERHAIAVADVLSRLGSTLRGDNKRSSARLRIVRTLKGRMHWPMNKILAASSEDQGEEVYWTGTPDLIAGNSYILFGNVADGSIGENVFWLDPCGVVPQNEQSLNAIQRGITASLAQRLPDN